MDDGGRGANARKRARKSRFAAATSQPINSSPSHSHQPNQLTAQIRETGEIVEDLSAQKRPRLYGDNGNEHGNVYAPGSGQAAHASVNPYASVAYTARQPQWQNSRSYNPMQAPLPQQHQPTYNGKNGVGLSSAHGYGNGGGWSANQFFSDNADCCAPSPFPSSRIFPTNCVQGARGDSEAANVTVFLSEVPVEPGGDAASYIMDIFTGGDIRLSAPPAVRVNESRSGKWLAWVTFQASSEAKAAVRLAKSHGLRARIHKESSTFSPKGYERRVATVLSNGGLANTLLLRNAPTALTERELRTFISIHDTPVLRIRTAQLGGKRAFWLVYASPELAKSAHAAMSRSKTPWTLRCGETYTAKPMLHDDSIDSDAKKRRANMWKLGTQKSTGDLFKDAGIEQASTKPAAQALEQFLLYNNAHLCMFMKG